MYCLFVAALASQPAPEVIDPEFLRSLPTIDTSWRARTRGLPDLQAPPGHALLGDRASLRAVEVPQVCEPAEWSWMQASATGVSWRDGVVVEDSGPPTVLIDGHEMPWSARTGRWEAWRQPTAARVETRSPSPGWTPQGR